MVLIIGDYTGRVGDPSGRSAMRPFVEGEEIDRNAETYQEQAFKVLDRDRTEVRRNGEWLDMPVEDLFRLARMSTVAQILERDDFAKRYAGGEPISILELLYPLLQGYDSVAIRSDVELGGTDQKFNILLAREIQKAYGVEPQSILTTPILPGIDGVQKMSKSLGNYVGVDEAARGDVREADAGPGRRDADLLRAAPGRGAPVRSPRREAAHGPRAHRALPRRRGGASGARGALRHPARPARAARRDRGVRLQPRERARASARADGGGLRAVPLGGASPARPRAASSWTGRSSMRWTSAPPSSTARCSRSGGAASRSFART